MLDNYTYYMKLAYLEATQSPDPSTQNGAVLLSHKNIGIGFGCNDFPKGVNANYWTSENKQDKYNRVVHAETAAIFDAAKNGQSTMGTTLICPWAACSNCAKHIAAAGVTRLVRHKYSNSGVTTGSHWFEDCALGDEIMTEAGIHILEIDPVPSDIELRRDHKLWSVGASQQN